MGRSPTQLGLSLKVAPQISDLGPASPAVPGSRNSWVVYILKGLASGTLAIRYHLSCAFRTQVHLKAGLRYPGVCIQGKCGRELKLQIPALPAAPVTPEGLQPIVVPYCLQGFALVPLVQANLPWPLWVPHKLFPESRPSLDQEHLPTLALATLFGHSHFPFPR